MKISITDKNGSGIIRAFAQAIGATTSGRFVHIPESKGEGYLTGFTWGSDLRMMVRHYYLKEDIVIERTNELADGQDDVIFLLSGVYSFLQAEKHLAPERAYVFICVQALSSLMEMPSNTLFGSVTIAVSRAYLGHLFGEIDHPVVASLLQAKGNFAFETDLSPDLVKTAGDMLHQPVPEQLENRYYRLKCEELLCYVFALLMQREATPLSKMHINDFKSIYAIKQHLQAHLDEAPDIASLARRAHMSQPKLRKLFKQTFGKGVFEYYQSMRMQEAARLLKEKGLTVSEVGYQLGFMNLSHFSRVFAEHIGSKPKKFSALHVG
ncbi:helix-turn-helix transcriptional regulator [Spirosoma pollinicola]|uniref:AraC family transcriptional regulator n=1 Tax=Spirosoma pollinicola TaxID=2057025 RepID=A0A2K8Z8H1_9BACT|nr:AraC family transcriptional regulator [Spirosoma pollinicola]AUD06158.1 AraC family transcriptional regulator [Spirosoma pollinicola]